MADAEGRVLQTVALQLGLNAQGRVCVEAIYVTRNPQKLAPPVNPPA